jgi:hypothetical protein
VRGLAENEVADHFIKQRFRLMAVSKEQLEENVRNCS